MPTPANLTDDELLRMYGDDFARDPAAAELARRFADYVDKQREARRFLGLPPRDDPH